MYFFKGFPKNSYPLDFFHVKPPQNFNFKTLSILSPFQNGHKHQNLLNHSRDMTRQRMICRENLTHEKLGEKKIQIWIQFLVISGQTVKSSKKLSSTKL